jgi:hypothetical protein
VEGRWQKNFLKLGLRATSEGLDPGISIYVIQIDDPFEDDSFIFVFDTMDSNL